MSADVQQINLYRPDTMDSAVSGGARLLLVSAIVILVSVVALAAASEFYLSGVRADRAALAERVKARQAELTQYREALPSRTQDPFLKAEVERLGLTQKQLQANLRAVMAQQQRSQVAFSDVFGGLARNTLDGLWLSQVGLRAGGSEMWLRGQTLQPALVPKWLQTLSSEPAFNGRTFRKVTFERRGDAQEPLVDFELRSATESEAADAG